VPAHDITDNHREELVVHINRVLASTEAARYAVGYFFLFPVWPASPKCIMKGVESPQMA
jgi:hypothetical protein